MTRAILQNTSGNRLVVKESTSADVTITFADTAGTTLIKSAFVTLTATLKHQGTTINSRSAQSVLDANGGTMTTAGVLTLKLQPADNAIIGSSAKDEEVHNLTIDWTYTDDDADTRTGQEDFIIYIQPDTVLNDTTSGWLG